MRLSIFSIIIYLVFSCNNRENPNIVGKTKIIEPKIKSACTTIYSKLKSKKIDLDNFSSLECKEYDYNGNVIKETKFNSDSSFDYENCYTYEFDLNNNLIKKQEYSKDGSLSYRTLYKYNDKNDEVENITYLEDDFLLSKNTKSYVYDLNDYKIKYSYKGKLYFGDEKGGEYLYKYDNNGNEIEELSLDLNGNQILKYVYKYNNAGKLINEKRYDSYNNLEHTSTYKRDSNGNRTEWHYKNSSLTEFKQQFKYDRNNNETEWIKLDKNDKQLEKTKYYYNGKNELIKKIELDSSNKITREIEFERKFNEYEDLIEKKTITNGELSELLKVEIKYYQ